MGRWFRKEEDLGADELLYDAHWCFLTSQAKEANRLIRLVARKVGDEHVSSQLEAIVNNGQAEPGASPPEEEAA